MADNPVAGWVSRILARQAWRLGLAADVDRAARKTDTDPTDAQREAGNYRMGRVRVHGLEVSIEVPRGAYRSKVGSDGRRWRRKMTCHYGYIKQTRAGDGDHVDVYLGDRPESEIVFVVNQRKKDGAFDEHKAMLGFDNEADAKAAYLAHYPANWTGLASIAPMTVPQFRAWLDDGDLTKPAALPG